MLVTLAPVPVNITLQTKRIQNKAKQIIHAYNLLKGPTDALGFKNVTLICSNHRHVLATCDHLRGGENKHTNTIIM